MCSSNQILHPAKHKRFEVHLHVAQVAERADWFARAHQGPERPAISIVASAGGTSGEVRRLLTQSAEVETKVVGHLRGDRRDGIGA